MSDYPIYENPNINVEDDTETPIVTSGSITGTEYVMILVDDGMGGYLLKKILLSELKTYMNA